MIIRSSRRPSHERMSRGTEVKRCRSIRVRGHSSVPNITSAKHDEVPWIARMEMRARKDVHASSAVAESSRSFRPIVMNSGFEQSEDLSRYSTTSCGSDATRSQGSGGAYDPGHTDADAVL